ncbi:MAG: cytochrome ubiquinol oxidase subunit I, partial [bacterium]
QPAKLAAFEAHYDSAAAGDLYLFGWVNDEQQQVNLSAKIPGGLSFLLYGDASKPVTGLNEFPPADRPPVNMVFQSYHFMVGFGIFIILITLTGILFWWRGTLLQKDWLLRILIFSVLAPQIANQLGWFSAEVGRQPWIVYGLMRTSEGLSKAISAGQTMFSLILFTLIYLLLFVLFIFLLDRKIKQGPEVSGDLASTYEQKRQSMDNLPMGNKST